VTELSIEPFANADLDGHRTASFRRTFRCSWSNRIGEDASSASGSCARGLERAGGLRLNIRTRTEGYYERFGASRSLGFRLTREHLGLGATESLAAR
jgi:hypothetical protein